MSAYRGQYRKWAGRTIVIERERAALRTAKPKLAESTMPGVTQGRGRFGAMSSRCNDIRIGLDDFLS